MSLTLIRTKICFFIFPLLIIFFHSYFLAKHNILTYIQKFDESLYSVARRTNVGSYYIVDIEIGRCECSVGIDGSPYWYQLILWSRGFSCCPNFLQWFNNSQRKRFAGISIGSSLEDSFYDTIHPCSEPEPAQIAEPSINQNSSVDQIDVDQHRWPVYLAVHPSFCSVRRSLYGGREHPPTHTHTHIHTHTHAHNSSN